MNKTTYKAFRWVDPVFQTGIDTFTHELVANQEWDIAVEEMGIAKITDIFGILSDIPTNAVATHELIEEFRTDVDNFDETFKAWSDHACSRREDFTDEEWHTLLIFSFVFRESGEVFHISSYKLIQNIKFWYMYGRRGNAAEVAQQMVYETASRGYISAADRLEFLSRFKAVNRKMQRDLMFDCIRLNIAEMIFPCDVSYNMGIDFTDTDEIVVNSTRTYRSYLTDEELDELDI